MACCQGLVCDSQVIRNNPFFFPTPAYVSSADPPNTFWIAASPWLSGCSLLCWKYLKLLLMFCCCMLPNFLCLFWNLIQGTNLAGGCWAEISPFRKPASVHRSCSQQQRSYIGTVKVFGMRLLKIILLAWFWGHRSKLQNYLQSIGRPGVLI